MKSPIVALCCFAALALRAQGLARGKELYRLQQKTSKEGPWKFNDKNTEIVEGVHHRHTEIGDYIGYDEISSDKGAYIIGSNNGAYNSISADYNLLVVKAQQVQQQMWKIAYAKKHVADLKAKIAADKKIVWQNEVMVNQWVSTILGNAQDYVEQMRNESVSMGSDSNEGYDDDSTDSTDSSTQTSNNEETTTPNEETTTTNEETTTTNEETTTSVADASPFVAIASPFGAGASPFGAGASPSFFNQ